MKTFCLQHVFVSSSVILLVLDLVEFLPFPEPGGGRGGASCMTLIDLMPLRFGKCHGYRNARVLPVDKSSKRPRTGDREKSL